MKTCEKTWDPTVQITLWNQQEKYENKNNPHKREDHSWNKNWNHKKLKKMGKFLGYPAPN